MAVAARRNKFACVTDMAAIRLETAPHQNPLTIPNAGCSVKNMRASIIAVMTILKA
jgi:hypothetical protein